MRFRAAKGSSKVTGEVGSGKTMLCRVLQTRLPKNVETCIYPTQAFLRGDPARDRLRTAIADCQGRRPPPGDACAQHLLLERHGQQRQVVVFVEDPRACRSDAGRGPSAFQPRDPASQAAANRAVRQPELDENLRQPQIRQLRERITHSFTLLPLDKDDVKAYLTFRLQAAGYHGPDLFKRRVIAYLCKASGGLTRRINLVADKALLAAFAEGTHNVTLRHVRAAVRDSEFSDLPRPRSPVPFAYATWRLAIGARSA